MLTLFHRFLRSDWLVVLVTGSFSWWLMHHTFTSSQGELHIAAKAWSDFGAHIPLIRSFSLGQNWPPEYPLFPNEPIRYHFLFYWVVGMLERFGVRIDLALNGVSAVGMTLMLTMIYRVAKLFFQKAAAGWLAVILAVTNGSLSAVILAQKLHLDWSQPAEWLSFFVSIISAQQFASFGPWDGNLVSAFWNLNIFTNQRHLALSLGLVWWVVWPLLVWWQGGKRAASPVKKLTGWFWLGLIGRIGVIAAFPLLHQAGLLITGWLVMSLLVIGYGRSSLRQKANHWLTGAYLAGLSLAALITMQFVTAGHQLPVWQPGFLAPDKSWGGLAMYWEFNLGLYLAIWIIGLGRRSAIRWLLWLVTPLFVAANLWKFSPDMINNHKLINFFIQVLAITAAGWLVSVWNQKLKFWWTRSVARVSAIVILVALTFSGLVDFFPILNDPKYAIPDWSVRPVAQWLKTNTPPNSVILTTTYLYHPASLAGRKIFLDYGYFAWSLGYNDQARRVLLPELFGQFDSIVGWCQAMQGQKLTAVVVSPGEGELGETVLVRDSFMVTQLAPTTTTEDGYQVYLVNNYCQ